MKGHPRVHEILAGLSVLHERKNTDYATGGIQGPLGNFERVSKIMALYVGMQWDTPIGVALCYLLKQFDAALMLLSTKRESINGEGVRERLQDVASYSVLGMVINEEGRKTCEIGDDAQSMTPYQHPKRGSAKVGYVEEGVRGKLAQEQKGGFE